MWRSEVPAGSRYDVREKSSVDADRELVARKDGIAGAVVKSSLQTFGRSSRYTELPLFFMPVKYIITILFSTDVIYSFREKP